MKRRALWASGGAILFLLIVGGGSAVLHRRSAVPTRVAGETTTESGRPLGRGSGIGIVPVRKPVSLGVRVEGLAIDDDEQPVPGATVGIDNDAVATTEDDGSFVLESFPAGPHTMFASKGDLYAETVDIAFLNPEPEPLIVRMRRGSTLVVHVVDDRGPVGGAQVSHRAVTATTDTAGTARVGGIGPGRDLVEVAAAGHVTGRITLQLGVDPGGTVEHTIELLRGAALDGTVRGPDDALVAGATVLVDGQAHAVETDVRGAWHIDAMGAGTHKITASSERFSATAPLSIDLDGEHPVRDVVVRVAAGGGLGGSVVTHDGAPVANASVVVWGDVAWVVEKETTTDARGAFELHGLAAGAHHARAYAGDLASAVAEVTSADGKRVEIRIAVAPAIIAGTVVDAHGEPLPEMRVDAAARHYTTDPTSRPTVVTDMHGHFSVSGLVPDDYIVWATPPTSAVADTGHPVRAHTGVTDVKIVIPDGGTITGRAMLGGAPLATFAVFVGSGAEEPFTTVRAPDGRFALHGISPGRWKVVVVGEHTQQWIDADVAVAPGQVVDLGDIALAAGIHIVGHVFAADGTAVAHARVSTVAERVDVSDSVRSSLQGRVSAVLETTTDATGAYRFDDVAIQKGMLWASHSLGASAGQPLPDHDAVIDFELQPSGGIDGTIPRELGARTLTVDGDGGFEIHADVGDDGAFHVDVPPGAYMVGGWGFRRVPVTVASGRRTSVALEAAP